MSDMPAWLGQYVGGMTNPEYWRVLIDGKHAAVIACRGQNYWTGHNQYAPAVQWLVTKGIGFWDDRHRVTWEGRVTSVRRAMMQVLLDERDALAEGRDFK